MLDYCVGEMVTNASRGIFGKVVDVILLTRLNGSEFYLNPELIQSVEKTPDTVVTLVNEKKLVVRESPEVIRQRYIEYRKQISQPCLAGNER